MQAKAMSSSKPKVGLKINNNIKTIKQMKTLYHISKIKILIASFALLFFTACSEDYPKNVESSNEVVLKSIKILNAGADGKTTLKGIIDESAKTVSFPRIDPETDFSNIRFEVELSNNAKMDKESYSFPFTTGESSKTIVVKVVNEPRFREYFVTLRLNVPVFGADFNKPQIYDYTNNELGNPVYPDFTGLATRGSSFDGEYVLVVTRTKTGSHLLKVEDLKNNKINPILFNLTGVSGGTFPVNCGAKIKGHTYIANLAGKFGLKIYHWTDAAVAPEIILNVDAANIPGAGVRYGDNMSANIDEKGNGYIFFGDNAATGVLRFKVTNFTTIDDPKILPTVKGVTSFMSFNKVDKTEDFIFTGYEAPIMVANADAKIAFTLDAAAVPLKGADARIVTFNKERYLIMATAARSGSDVVVLYVYDITKGNTTIEALTLFNQKADKKPIYEYSLLGPTNTAPSTQTGWYIEKDDSGNDDKLMLYAASADAGFVIIELPKKKLEEE